MKKYIIGFILVLLLLAGFLVVRFGNFGGTERDIVATTTPIGGGVVCEEEAIQCPDGSLVQRSGPNCDFEKCPDVVDDPVACTMEAEQCPDGSYVGRSGPKCEFAPCPTTNNFVVKLCSGSASGQSGIIGDKYLVSQCGNYYSSVFSGGADFPTQIFDANGIFLANCGGLIAPQSDQKPICSVLANCGPNLCK